MSVMRVIMDGLYLAKKCQNVLHFNNPDGASSHENIRDELIAHWLPILRNMQNNGLSYTQVSIQTVSSPPDVASLFPLSGQSGALSGAGAPSVLCGLFSIRTSFPGRHGHGRFYSFGVHQDSVLNGVFQSGALAAYVTAANSLVDRYKTGGTGPITLVVCPRADPSSFHPMTAIIVRPVFGIQRRRNIGVGG